MLHHAEEALVVWTEERYHQSRRRHWGLLLAWAKCLAVCTRKADTALCLGGSGTGSVAGV